jgi:hypothetical protein
MSVGKGLRHLLFFQVKLALDALRDFLLSPLSVGAFLLDAITRPPYERSLTYRLMLLGRRSDRVINLFDEHGEGGHYTVDETLGSVEQSLQARRRGPGGTSEHGGEPPL